MLHFHRFLIVLVLLFACPTLAETKRPVVVRVPQVGVVVKLALAAKAKSTVTVGLTMKDRWGTKATGNTAVIMSAKPFFCGTTYSNYKEVPFKAYKNDWEVENIRLPNYAKDWYGCVVCMHGRVHWKRWDTPITPSVDQQDLIVVGYWSEED